jgi:phosphoglucosamine mutase
MVVSGSFFGTDGIRGETTLREMDEDEAIALLEQERSLSPAFMRVLGEALSHVQPEFPGSGSTVVIGWDERPHNAELVGALTLGLRLTGSRVIHIGVCATPTLHHAVLAFDARMGCMITASHNPVSDSGIKVFNAYGYKTTRANELEISRTLRQLAEEDREVDASDRNALQQADETPLEWATAAHPSWLEQRFALFEDIFGGWGESRQRGAFATPFLVDSASGFASSWLAQWLTERGLPCEEVSGSAPALNADCGAGDFSPTQTWTHEEAAASSHALLKRLVPGPEGQWVGAALDGDGDRCLIIEATRDGYKVVDGDAMAAILMAAGRQEAWTFGASIESDVALMGYIASLHDSTKCFETAVGDRWLSFALRPQNGGWLKSASMPKACGIEDSGHVVLPAPHPSLENKWSLVGDGSATLCAVLLAADRGMLHGFERGWKQRVSIKESQRERWHADAGIFRSTCSTILSAFTELGFSAERRYVEGEENLLLVHGVNGEDVVSFGIRNSGTQAKTSLSIRLSPSLDSTPFVELLDEVQATLKAVLQGD